MSSELWTPEGADLDPNFEPYQQEAFDALEVAREGGLTSGGLDMATGLGKTRIVANDIARFLDRYPEGRVMSLCHNSFILEQNRDEILAATGGMPHGQMFDGEYDGDKQLVSATFQTMGQAQDGGRTFEAFDPGEFGYVWVDESHHSPAPTYQPVIEHFRPWYFRAWSTATTERRDEKEIEEIVGPAVYTLRLEEAIARGYLARPDYRVFADKLKHLGISGGVDWHGVDEINGMVFVPKRDQEIVDTVARHLEQIDDPRTIFFCASIDHAEHFSKLFAGNSTALHSNLGPHERKDRLEAFKRGDIPALFVVDMLNEGVDVPEINSVVFLRSTESKTVFLQELGRGLHKFGGKEEILVLDFVANWERLSTLRSLQADIQRHQSHSAGESNARVAADAGISFNFSPEAMEAIRVVQEARKRERRREPKPKQPSRRETDESELKAMLGTDRLPPSDISPGEWAYYAKEIDAGNRVAGNELIARSLLRAYGIAKRSPGTDGIGAEQLSVDDRMHIALESMYGVLENYSSKQKTSLSSRISSALSIAIRHESQTSGLIRLSTRIYDQLNRIKEAETKVDRDLGAGALDSLSLYEQALYLSDYNGMDPGKIVHIREILRQMGHDQLLPAEEASGVIDDRADVIEEVADRERRRILEEMLVAGEPVTSKELTYRERQVLRRRSGFKAYDGEDGPPLTLDEVGRLWNVTRENIRQIEDKAYKKLKAHGNPFDPKDIHPEHLRYTRIGRFLGPEVRSQALGRIHEYVVDDTSGITHAGYIDALSTLAIRHLYRGQHLTGPMEKQEVLESLEADIRVSTECFIPPQDLKQALHALHHSGLAKLTWQRDTASDKAIDLIELATT